jgi:hypothetical protein
MWLFLEGENARHIKIQLDILDEGGEQSYLQTFVNSGQGEEP